MRLSVIATVSPFPDNWEAALQRLQFGLSALSCQWEILLVDNEASNHAEIGVLQEVGFDSRVRILTGSAQKPVEWGKVLQASNGDSFLMVDLNQELHSGHFTSLMQHCDADIHSDLVVVSCEENNFSQSSRRILGWMFNQKLACVHSPLSMVNRATIEKLLPLASTGDLQLDFMAASAAIGYEPKQVAISDSLLPRVLRRLPKKVGQVLKIVWRERPAWIFKTLGIKAFVLFLILTFFNGGSSLFGDLDDAPILATVFGSLCLLSGQFAALAHLVDQQSVLRRVNIHPKSSQ